MVQNGRVPPLLCQDYEAHLPCKRVKCTTLVHRLQGDHVAVDEKHLTGVDRVMQREAMVMRRCAHPNIIQLHTSFTHQQDLWLVMDYMNGGENTHQENSTFQILFVECTETDQVQYSFPI
jgi:hypothetical protein